MPSPSSSPSPWISRAAAHLWRATPVTVARRLTRGRYQAARHVVYVCARIAPAVLRGDARIIVQLPPRHGKSELVSVWLVVWFLSLFPHRRVLLASYGADLARTFAQRVRDIIAENSSALGVKLSPGSRKAHDWNTTKGGGVLAGGVGGPFTGRGGDLVVIDDPFKNEQEAESETYRERVWSWWQATVYTRLEPGASVIVMHTRWHEDDLAGRLQRESAEAVADGEYADRWEVIDLPALARPDGDALGRGQIACPVCGGTGARTDTDRPDAGECSACSGTGKIGEALWPERRSPSQLLRIRRAIGSYFFAALFQQAPAPSDGGIFPRAWWRYHTADPRKLDERTRATPPAFDIVVQSWDMAFTDTGSSYVVGGVWAKRGADVYLLDQVRGKMEYPAAKAAIRTLSAKWPQATLKLVENKANGPAIIADLTRSIPGLVAVEPLGDKVARARANTGAIESGNVYLPLDAPWLHDFIEEHAIFPNGTNDDQVDQTSQALTRLLAIVPASADDYAAVKAR